MQKLYFCGMVKFNAFEKSIDFSFWKEICEKYGKPQQVCRGEYFVHSGVVMKNVGWILSGGFKHSLTASDGSNKTVGFVFADSILANYESVMLAKKMQTDIIALEDSEVIVAPAKILRERLLCDPTLHTRFIQALFEQLYEQFLDFYRYTPEQRFTRLLERCPLIVNLVPYSEIASYLNISRRQFQRIRDKLTSKD